MFRVETLQILNTNLPNPNTSAQLRGNHEADYKIVQREGAEAEEAPKGEVLAQNTWGGVNKKMAINTPFKPIVN